VFQFSGMIGFIFFLELAAVVLVVVFQGQVRDWINDFFLNNIKAYRDDVDLQNLIDSLQRLVGVGVGVGVCELTFITQEIFNEST